MDNLPTGVSSGWLPRSSTVERRDVWGAAQDSNHGGRPPSVSLCFSRACPPRGGDVEPRFHRVVGGGAPAPNNVRLRVSGDEWADQDIARLDLVRIRPLRIDR